MPPTLPSRLPIGTIIHGTCDCEDIASAILDELERIQLTKGDRANVERLRAEMDDIDADPHDILEDVYNLAEVYTPPHTVLGAHPDDGADIGIWPCVESVQAAVYDHDDSVTVINAGDGLEGVPDTVQELLVINDHGNATLWERYQTGWREVWSVV